MRRASTRATAKRRRGLGLCRSVVKGLYFGLEGLDPLLGEIVTGLGEAKQGVEDGLLLLERQATDEVGSALVERLSLVAEGELGGGVAGRTNRRPERRCAEGRQ